jgi:sulfopyruvate decarboxylase TPP-binding subunit
MLNSGLGNSLNALLSLTRFYKLGLLLVMGFRGLRGEEKVEAQIPMGDATEGLLSVLGAESTIIRRPDDIPLVKEMALRAFDQEGITAVLLTPNLWKDI